jgi:hypothetical protein
MGGYDIDPVSRHGRELAQTVLENCEPYLDAEQYPAMADERHHFVVFMIDGQDPMADIGRAVEGSVLANDWHLAPDVLAASRQEIEPTTTWFVIVDRTESMGAMAVGAMSVADCCRGVSETLQAAETVARQSGVALPPELRVQPVDRDMGLWDVMQISVLRSHRASRASQWLQYALYRASIEGGIGRWVCNMTDKEFHALTSAGIPFQRIAGIEGTDFWGGSAAMKFGFQSINVAEIEHSVSAQIAQLLAAPNRKRFYRYLADAGSISINGHTADPPSVPLSTEVPAVAQATHPLRTA